MKNKILALFASMSLVTACSDGTSGKTDADAGVYPQAAVGVSISGIEGNLFFQKMYERLETIGREQDGLTLIAESADNDQNKQNAQLEAMVTKGAQALVVNLVDTSTGGTLLNHWCSKGIPVIYIDRSPGSKPLASCDNAYLVSSDNAQAGIVQGIQVLELWQKNPAMDKNGDGIIQYALLKGLPDHEGTEQRSKWSVGTMTSYPQLGKEIEGVFETFAMFDEAKAEETVKAWMQKPEFNSVEVILANNDTMALGALAALHSQNRTLPVFGIDGSKAALEAIGAGHLAGTVFNDFRRQSDAALRMAANLAASKDVMEGVEGFLREKTVIIPTQNINKDNLENFMELYR